MFDLTKSYFNDLKERAVVPGAMVIEEGCALVYGDDGAGGLAVKPCDATSAAASFAGWAITDKTGIITEVLVEKFTAPAAAPQVFQLAAGNVSLYLTPAGPSAYDASAFNLTTNTALVVTFASAADALAGRATVAAGVAANDLVQITYRHTLTAEELYGKYHERSINNRAQDFFGLVSVGCLEGEIFTSMFDAQSAYVVDGAVYLDVTPGAVPGKVTSKVSGPQIGIVSQLPSVNAGGLLGVKWKTAYLDQ